MERWVAPSSRPLRRLAFQRHRRCALLALGAAAGAAALPGLRGPAFLLQSAQEAPCPRAAPHAAGHRRAPGQPGARPAARGEQSAGGRPAWQAQLLAVACAALVALTAPLQLAAPAFAEEDVAMLTAEEQETVSIFDRSTPGVVFITNQVYKIEDYASREVKEVPQGTGSGWVFDMDGHIVTNFHVVQGSNSLLVKFIEGTEVPAKVVGADPGSDVAVLKVDLPPARAKKLLKPLSVGKSAGLKVGQEVFAIGNPFGLDHTLTKGIVSGVARTIKSVSDRPISGAIQTDASINPGNSGGPLISSRGQVVGMNTVIFSPSGASAGVGFAIPSDTVAARVASIIQYGYVKRPSLGIYLGQDGLAQRLTGRKDGGVFIAGLRPGDAAQQGGVLPGDIIIQLDKRRTKGVNDIFAEIDEHQPGDQLDIKLLRTEDPRAALEGEPSTYREYTAKVTLTEAPLTSDR